MNRLRQMIKDCPYENKGCVPGDCVLCFEAPRGIRRECLEIIKQGGATQIFKELEEYFGLHETDCNGKDVLVKLTVREDIVMNYDNKSMTQLNIYQAIKSRWVKE